MGSVDAMACFCCLLIFVDMMIAMNIMRFDFHSSASNGSFAPAFLFTDPTVLSYRSGLLGHVLFVVRFGCAASVGRRTNFSGEISAVNER